MGQSVITKKREKGVIERVSTGDPVLDSVLCGGFPRGSVIYVTGNPGTGKSTLGSTFLYRGARDHGETGMYISFGEVKEIFYRNMEEIGFDFESLEEDKKFDYIEMITASVVGAAAISDKIVSAIVRMRPDRLVIDSFSVIAQSEDSPYKARELMDSIFSKLISSAGCTTLVIGEQATGESKLGIGSEEFVSDGVLNLKHTIPRVLEIRKMRGTKIGRENLLYTISNKGFEAVETACLFPEIPKEWKPVSDQGELLSTGSAGLDNIIGGGFPRGAYVLLEVASDVSYEEFRVLSDGITLNFVSQGRGVIISTTGGQNKVGIRDSLVRYLTDESVDKYLKVVDYNVIAGHRPQSTELIVTGVSDDLGYQGRIRDVYSVLKKETSGKPIFQWIGYDTLASSFSTIPDEKVVHQIGSNIAENRSGKDLTIALARPSFRILDTMSDIVNWHLKIWKQDDVVLIRGVKPATRVYATTTNIDQGYPVLCLTELN